MRRITRVLLIVGLLAGAFIAALIIAGPILQARVFYPKPTALPASVGESTDVLLARLEKTLQARTPELARHLQPGLTDEAIRQWETAGGFRLPEDLRALYRWHNGQAPDSPDGLLPGVRFLSLENVVLERLVLRQQVAALSFGPRLYHRVFAGHRHPWVQILDDGSADGYFVDPSRRDVEGAFFYHFSENGHYTWFPSLRNFLAGLIECYDSGAVRLTPDRKQLEEDSDRTRLIWQRLARATEI